MKRCISFAAIDDAAELENAKARYLGKEGSLTGLLKGLGKLSAEERPAAGARINQVKQQIEAALQARRDAIAASRRCKPNWRRNRWM